LFFAIMSRHSKNYVYLEKIERLIIITEGVICF